MYGHYTLSGPNQPDSLFRTGSDSRLKANEMQNAIAKFKTPSKFQDKNSNFAPTKTQRLNLALLLLLTAHLAHKTPQNYRPRSIVDALDLHGQTHDPEVAPVGRC